jgi:hypothetical protein
MLLDYGPSLQFDLADVAGYAQKCGTARYRLPRSYRLFVCSIMQVVVVATDVVQLTGEDEQEEAVLLAETRSEKRDGCSLNWRW